MQKSAEALNFESAARIREIAGLKSLNADQKVSLPDDTVSRDAIAQQRMSNTPAFSCSRRAGQLVGRRIRADAHAAEPGTILQRVLRGITKQLSR